MEEDVPVSILNHEIVQRHGESSWQVDGVFVSGGAINVHRSRRVQETAGIKGR